MGQQSPGPDSAPSKPPSGPARQVLAEALLVAVSGLVLALAANALSPRKLELTRDYFYLAQAPATNNLASPPRPGATNATNPPSHLELLAARLQQKGLTLARSNQVIQLYQDPRCEQNLVVFIDARDNEHYQQGHIPGAYQFDFYNPGKYLATLFPLCQFAQQIVVYCNGGECEDSELAATFLRDGGVAKEKLLIYGGGMTEWSTNALPVELGERKSGQFKGAK